MRLAKEEYELTFKLILTLVVLSQRLVLESAKRTCGRKTRKADFPASCRATIEETVTDVKAAQQEATAEAGAGSSLSRTVQSDGLKRHDVKERPESMALAT